MIFLNLFGVYWHTGFLLTVGEVSWTVISLLRVKLKHETVQMQKKMSLKINKFMK